MHAEDEGSQVNVTHAPERQRFEALLEDGEMALLEYRRSEGTITFTHTEVPPRFEGHGIAGYLARAALEFARSEGLGVIVRCSFVGSYIHRHPEYQALLSRR